MVVIRNVRETQEDMTSQDTARKQQSKGDSPSGDGRGRDKAKRGKKATERGALTSWRLQREGGGVYQGTKRKRRSDEQ